MNTNLSFSLLVTAAMFYFLLTHSPAILMLVICVAEIIRCAHCAIHWYEFICPIIYGIVTAIYLIKTIATAIHNLRK